MDLYGPGFTVPLSLYPMKADSRSDLVIVLARRDDTATNSNTWHLVSTIIAVGFVLGYLLGFAAKDTLFTSRIDAIIEKSHLVGSLTHGRNLAREADKKVAEGGGAGEKVQDSKHPFPGDTIHVLFTSSGDAYQNFQTRIKWETFKLVQKMPGGEKMTAFTRILHRTVPDILMEEVPTFHVWDVLKPQCDGWCDYPVANRPNAIAQFFQLRPSTVPEFPTQNLTSPSL
eukprot:gene9118-16240_t